MAVTVTSVILLLLLALSSLPAPSLCRRHSRPASYATLDVSAALAAASSAISGQTPLAHQSLISHHHRHHGSGHGRLAFPLHPRASLAGAHRSYSDLTLSRLRRDSARVVALTSRLRLALSGALAAELTPLESTQLRPESAMEGPVVSGTRQGSGEYFSRVGFGTPARELYVVLDTGSDVTWVQCQPCADCYQQADPLYDPAASTTFAAVPCASPRCQALDVSACRNGSCLYQVSYGDGSYTVGDFATETVSFGSDGTHAVPGVAFGCGHDNEGLFVGAAGLLGLGRGALSFPSQLPASSFSYCLVDRDSVASSTLEFGRNGSAADSGLFPAATATDTVTAPLLRNRKLDTFYYVGLTGLSVGGRSLPIPETAFAMDGDGNGGVIVDSGTAVTRLHPQAYAALRDAFRAGTSGLPTADGVALFDTCYDLSSKTTVEVPTVAMRFAEGRELRLPAKNYLIPVDGQGTFCLAFAATSSPEALSIIGNVQQQGTRVSFDLENNRVGFSSNKC